MVAAALELDLDSELCQPAGQNEDRPQPGGSVGVVHLDDGAGIEQVVEIEHPFDTPLAEAEDLLKGVRDASSRVPYLSFAPSDGLVSSPMRYGSPSAGRSSDGRLWFATMNGFAVIDPSRVERPRSATARIDSATADGRTLTLSRNTVVVPSLTSRLEIRYGALSLAGASKVRLQYRLEGFDQTWVDAGLSRQAVYTGLPPRPYRFRVRVRNSGAEQSEAIIGLSVVPAFYQTSLFYVSCVGIAAVLLWSIWELRVRALQRRFSMVLTERSRIARELHDTTLQAMVGLVLQIERIARKLDTAASPLSGDLRQVRRQFEHQVTEARHAILDLRAPSGHSLAGALTSCAKDLLPNRSEHFELTITGNPRPRDPAVHDEVLRIGQEAIRNAFRHAHAQHIHVELHGRQRESRDSGCSACRSARRRLARACRWSRTREAARGSRCAFDRQGGPRRPRAC